MNDRIDSDSKTEETRLSGHVYDGIEELDNALPRWWINLFYLTILFSAGYFFHYILGDGPTLVAEYQHAKNGAGLASLAEKSATKAATENELQALLGKAEIKKAGESIFQSRCVSCHGSRGEGGIGPNLTDNYWLHGGKMTQIVQTVTQGVSDKGMPPWGPLLSQEEIHSVVVHIKSLGGTHPPGAKAPQGELEKE